MITRLISVIMILPFLLLLPSCNCDVLCDENCKEIEKVEITKDGSKKETILEKKQEIVKEELQIKEETTKDEQSFDEFVEEGQDSGTETIHEEKIHEQDEIFQEKTPKELSPEIIPDPIKRGKLIITYKKGFAHQLLHSSQTNAAVMKYLIYAYGENISTTGFKLMFAKGYSSGCTPASNLIKNIAAIKIFINTNLVATGVINATGLVEIKFSKPYVFIKNMEHELVIKVDTKSKISLVSDSHMVVGFLKYSSGCLHWNSQSGYYFNAKGVSSGQYIPMNTINDQGAITGNIHASETISLYDGVLHVSISPISPIGNSSISKKTNIMILDFKAFGDSVRISNIGVEKYGSCKSTGKEPAFWETLTNIPIVTFPKGTAWLNNNFSWKHIKAQGIKSLVVHENKITSLKLSGDTTQCSTGSTLFFIIVKIEYKDDESPTVIDNYLYNKYPIKGEILIF